MTPVAQNIFRLPRHLEHVTRDHLLATNIALEQRIQEMNDALTRAAAARTRLAQRATYLCKENEQLRDQVRGLQELYVRIQKRLHSLPVPELPPAILARATTHPYTLTTLPPIIGHSPRIITLLEHIEKLRNIPSTILINGETGTGKELTARHLATIGAPFVPVNCGALPAELLSSELFGHTRGAFTGATDNHTGLFEQAHGGTLFLDEISELPLPLQATFLRAIEERVILPVGSTQSIHVNVRIIAATNKDLTALVNSGQFREDLYYRLNVIPLTIPPLRERPEDISDITNHFIAIYEQQHGIKVYRTPQFMDALQAYSWPGNVRQLHNELTKHLALAERAHHDITLTTFTPTATLNDSIARSHTLQDSERIAIEQALERSHGNKSHAAQELGITRSTLYRKLKQYNTTP